MRRILTILAVAAVLASCGGTPRDGSSQVAERARTCGRHDAMLVVEAPAGSYEREDALLRIVARASELTEMGYVRAAQTYKQAAYEVLVDSMIIE